jgi:SAM-dependent methyltransferase
MRLNLGCGAQVVDGWVNVDYALGARLAKLPLAGKVAKKLKVTRLDWDERIFIHNLTTRFPWPEGSADTVYSSHTLEHFTKTQGRFFVGEIQRVLRPGGLLRIVVPDLKAIVDDYVDGHLRADDFVEALDVLSKPAAGALKRRLAPLFQYGHKCMYDGATLLELLQETGFTAAIRAAFESDIEGIELIEREDRTGRAVIVEGRKV